MVGMDVPTDSQPYPWKYAAVIAGAYLVAALLGWVFWPVPVVPLWFLSGIGLAALWVGGRRLWPVVLLSAWAIALSILTRLEVPLPMAAGLGLGLALVHTFEALLARALLRWRRVPRYPLDTLRNAFYWVALGGVVSTLFGALGSTALLSAAGLLFNKVYYLQTRWFSGVVAVLVVGTLLVVWCTPERRPPRHSLLERALALLFSWLGAAFIFGGVAWYPPLTAYHLDYLILPLLTALVLRYGERMETLVMLGALLMAIVFTLGGTGPFVGEDLTTAFFRLHLHLAVVSGLMLVFLGGVSQREAAETGLQALVDSLREHNRRIELLNDITLQALEAANEYELLQRLAARLAELWEADACYISLWDEVNRKVIPGAAYGPYREAYRRMRLDPEETPLAESVLRAGEPIFVPDALHSEHISATIVERFPTRALLGIPLIANRRWLGAVLVGFQSSRQMTPEEMLWAQRVGAMVALALQKVQLYVRTLDGLTREQRLAAITALFSADLDLDATLERVTELLTELVDADAGALALIDEDGEHMLYPHLVGLPASLAGARVPRGKGGLAWYIVDTQESLLLDDYRQHMDSLSEWSRADIQAFLGVPILAHEQCLGAIGLFRRPGRQPFTPQDAALIASIGRQAGLAIQNALLYRREHTLRQRAETLREIALDVTASLDLETILNRLLEHLRSMVPFGSASVFLVEDAGLRLVTGRNLRRPEEVLHHLFPLDDALFREICRTSRPLMLEDPAAHPQFQGWGGTHDIQCWLGVPLRQRDEVIGYITLDRYEKIPYSAEEISLAEAVTSQAAAAIAQARLFQQTEQRARQLAVLYEFSQQFVRQVDPERIAGQACRLAIERLEALFAWVGMVPGGEIHLMPLGFAHSLRRVELSGGGDTALPEISAALAQTGFAHQALRSGAPLVVERLEDGGEALSEEDRAILASLGSVSVTAFSLRHGGQVLGVLLMGSGEADFFLGERLRFMQSFANQVSVALENARLFADTRRHLEYLQALHTIDMTINASLDLDVTLSVLVRQLVSQLRVDAVAIFVLDPKTNLLTYRLGEGFQTTSPAGTRLRLGQGRAGKVALTRQPAYIADLRKRVPAGAYTAALIHEEGFIAYYGAPLIAKGQVKGVLEIYNRRALRPDAQWMEFLNAVAAQAAIAMDNAALFQSLERSNFDLLLAYDTTLEGWSRALELRDAETEGHSERVTEMTLRLARAMGISDEKLIHIRYGALLHDIGKMGIPDHILYKPGPLTEEEWEIMRQHPVYAYNLLAPIPYLRQALDIPYCHHERWQGQGYPRGLKGEQIPLAARIFAVVDVWDALSKDRPYRKAWPQDKVKRYLREQAGIQFDPKVVDVFLRVLDEESG